jgi:hypothetical protein
MFITVFSSKNTYYSNLLISLVFFSAGMELPLMLDESPLMLLELPLSREELAIRCF